MNTFKHYLAETLFTAYSENSNALYSTSFSKYVPAEVVDLSIHGNREGNFLYKRLKSIYNNKASIKSVEPLLLTNRQKFNVYLQKGQRPYIVSLGSIVEESDKILLKLAIETKAFEIYHNVDTIPTQSFILFISNELYEEKYKKLLKEVQGYIKILQRFDVEVVITTSDAIENYLYPKIGIAMERSNILQDEELMTSFIFESTEVESPF
jgi:hypothetical protein